VDQTVQRDEGKEKQQSRFSAFLNQLSDLLRPHLGRVEFGNLRCEVCDGEEALNGVSNVAIVYETPGGSTDQINIDYDSSTGCFHLMQEDGEVVEADPQPILKLVAARVAAIPEKRQASLRRQVEQWLSEGHSRGQMFAQVNRLLQSGLRGGQITAHEMREVIKYIVDRHSQPSSQPG